MTQAPPPQEARQSNGLAIAAIATGGVAFVLGWVPMLGLIIGSAAIILAVLALVKKQQPVLSYIGIGLAVLAVVTSLITTIIFAVSLSNAGTSSAAPRVTATPMPTEEPEPTGIEIPDLVGQPGDDADDALKALGFKTEFDAGDETVVMRSNWTVTGITPAAGERAEKGTTVTIHVAKDEPEPQAAEQTTLGLTGTPAWAMCEAAGDSMFPYGFRIHLTGVMADAPQEDVWFLKATVTTENEFGNKRKDQVMECYVTGTSGAPVLQDFLIY